MSADLLSWTVHVAVKPREHDALWADLTTRLHAIASEPQYQPLWPDPDSPHTTVGA